MGQCVDTLLVCTARDTLLEYIFFLYLNFDKLYVYTMNAYLTVKWIGMLWEKVLPPFFVYGLWYEHVYNLYVYTMSIYIFSKKGLVHIS